VSHLYVRSPTLGVEFKLNCVAFSTVLSSQMSSVQTKKMMHHFPVKAQQPEVSFDLIFNSEKEHERFWRFTRAHQQAALNSWPNPEINLWWPERDIYNWSGLVKNFRAGGARRNYTPRAKLTVDLIDSVFSQRTDIASAASSIWQVAGYGSAAGMLNLPSILNEVVDDAVTIAESIITGVFGRGGQ
jgi:hypothetical protein